MQFHMLVLQRFQRVTQILLLEFFLGGRSQIILFSSARYCHFSSSLPLFCQFILFLCNHFSQSYFPCLFQIANHPLLVRRVYSDEDVICFAKKLHPKGAFGFECTLERVIEELKSYNDFSIHRVIFLFPRGPVRYTRFYVIACELQSFQFHACERDILSYR